MGFILFVGVALGFAAALVATAYLARRILATMMPRGPEAAPQRRTVFKGATAGAVIGLGPALLLGTVIGATLGGNYGAALAQDARDSGALAGVVLGVFAVTTILLSGCVWVGAWVGRRIARGT
jgi:hypothetical protein